jgi:hypothetical protein
MNAQTDNASPSPSALGRYLAARRNPTWMRARVGFNIFRFVLGILILGTMPVAGPLALLGIIPIVWAAVSSWWIYRVHQSAQSATAPSAAR